MRRNIVRLTESDLHRLIKESVHRVINEGSEQEAWARLRRAKETGDPRAILDALHNLEREIEFVCGGTISNGTWQGNSPDAFTTRDSKGNAVRDPRFKQTWGI